jgi:hypothetical protein
MTALPCAPCQTRVMNKDFQDLGELLEVLDVEYLELTHERLVYLESRYASVTFGLALSCVSGSLAGPCDFAQMILAKGCDA